MKTMADMKLRTVIAIAIVILLFILLVLGLAFQRTRGFFITGSLDVLIIFVILSWSFVRFNFLQDRRIGVLEVSIVIVIVHALLLVITLSCIHSSEITFYVVSSFASAIALLFASQMLVLKYLAWRKQIEASAEWREDEELQLEHTFLREVAGLPKRIRYLELKTATNNIEIRIGRGGSGSVFKGILDGLLVAVKRIEGEMRGEKEFMSEITAILSVQHVNLVRILGYCLVPRSYRFLVYEFFENGSLDSWIFQGSTEKGRCLRWSLRYQVAIDVAKALAYLHHDCRVRILHLDVKPENILLDKNFRARVSDFGISRLMEKDESKVLTTVRGTRGYLAPEWFLGVGISEKCDVYSYGMVLLELIGGRRNAHFSDHVDINERRLSYFPKIVSQSTREGKIMEPLDARLLNDGSVIREADVRTLVYVALWCIQEKAELRPSMDQVVKMLQGYIPLSIPPETTMFMVDLVLPSLNAQTTSAPSASQSNSTALTENSLHPLLSLDAISVSI